MKDNSLTNGQIERMLKGVKSFKGCFCSDDLPKKREIGFYVFNLDKERNPGTHWTMGQIKKDGSVYVDAFGMPPSNEVEKFLTHGNGLMVNTHDIQSMRSTCCGYFSVYMIKQLNMGRKPKDVISDFYQGGRLFLNDRIVDPNI